MENEKGFALTVQHERMLIEEYISHINRASLEGSVYLLEFRITQLIDTERCLSNK